MGLFQKAYETYENHQHYIGLTTEGIKEPLAPVAHIITSASLEITIDADGQFVSASAVDKKEPKIIIPALESSAGRAGTTIAPHPLCDQLGYISELNPKKMEAYLAQLTEWTESEFSHPMLSPILQYVQAGTILNDLNRSGLTKIGEKDMIRWIVVGLEDGGSCWTNRNLQDAFVRFYTTKKTEEESVLCMVSGKETAPANQHLKGIISINGNAKLISANDTSNFTFRGRFKTDNQALTVGYEASQKAHNALKWLAAAEGVPIIGGRTFLCWNPKGKALPRPLRSLRKKESPIAVTLEDYRKDLAALLWGYQEKLEPADCAVIAVFDAATTGRLALTYYNEMAAAEFLEKLRQWDEECCWKHYRFGISSPSLDTIVRYAFGTERGNFVEADDRVMRQQLQRLLICRLDGAPMPYDIMRLLVQNTMHPQAYKNGNNLAELQSTSCAVIRKYYLDHKQEEYRMALEKGKKDISYQYGRLLAVLEKAERDTYDNAEGREPNAIRLQSMFCTRPAQTARSVIEQLKKSYYPRLSPGLRNYYDRLIGEIYEQLSFWSEAEWNAPLKETYILGYYLQKNALYTRNTDTETEE